MSKQSIKRGTDHLPPLPSKFQLYDRVVVDFGRSGKLMDSKVIKVHCGDGDATYDVAVMFELEDPAADKRTVRLYNLSEVLLKKMEF